MKDRVSGRLALQWSLVSSSCSCSTSPGVCCSCVQAWKLLLSQEWIHLVAKHYFGEYGDVFEQCPNDPATVHPIRAPGRGGTYPDASEVMMNAGRLAGMAFCACSTQTRARMQLRPEWQQQPQLWLAGWPSHVPAVCCTLVTQQQADVPAAICPPQTTLLADLGCSEGCNTPLLLLKQTGRLG